jgi:TolB-like protein/DNA-binding SARP family transcriptional activator
MADQGHKADLVWTSELTLGLLGPVRLSSSAGDDVTPKARKTRALLALVALSKVPLSRARLSDLLWGDRGDDQAKASLRQALYELRSLSSNGYIVADRQAVGPGAKRLSTDIGVVRRLIEGHDAADLADALDDVECPLLGGLDDITPELDDWLRDERSRISSSLVTGALGVAEQSLRCGDIPAARRIADQLERLDPLDERVAQLGIVADIAGGDRAAALRRHGRLSGRLDHELGIRPAVETEALLDRAKTAPSSPASGLTLEAPELHKRRWLLPALAALALLVAVAVLVAFTRSTPVAATPTVAVLPFDDLGQRNEDYFASGVSDEILNLLGRQRQLKVLGRTSAAQLGDPAQSLETARKLGVTYLLDGSVRTADDRILVIARLTRVADGAQVWSERYERKAGDIFAVQGDIAGAVAARVAQAFAGVRPQQTTPDVYDRYLAARQLIRERRETTLREADRLLREAIARDPQYAPAYAELAQLIMLESDHPTSYGSIPFAQARAEAEPFARKAAALDPDLGDGYAAIGFLSLSLDASAEPYLRKAVQLSPQRPEFHRWHAQTLEALNRYDDAVVEFKRAVEIDPLWGLNYDHLIGALYLVGQGAEAKQYARRFFDLSTDQRAKLLLLQSLQKFDDDVAGQLKTTSALQHSYPDERQMRLNLASTLSLLGDNQAAAKLVGYDRLGTAALSRDWPALANAARAMGANYWDQSGYWNSAALLVASGHGDTLVQLYDAARPLVAEGRISADRLAQPETIIALRKAGRQAEADRLFTQFQEGKARLPNGGILGDEKRFSVGIAAALTGNREAAIRALDHWSRTRPLRLAPIPAMALRYDPTVGWLASDPRFSAIEDRVRLALNAHRQKAGLAPLPRPAWISDPKALLTKN